MYLCQKRLQLSRKVDEGKPLPHTRYHFGSAQLEHLQVLGVHVRVDYELTMSEGTAGEALRVGARAAAAAHSRRAVDAAASVGRCRMSVSKSELKACLLSALETKM